MQLSKRLIHLSPSPTVALNAKAKELKKTGADVLNFAVGEPDFPTPSAIVDKAIAALKAGKTRYGPAGGSLPFREAIANKLQRENNLHFSSSQIVTGIGAKEILFHLFLATINEGDEVIVNAPAWVSYKEQIKAAGGIPVIIPISDDMDQIISLEKIESVASDKTAAYILCSPNNPAGYALPEKELKKLGDYLSTKSWWVFADEIYEYLSFDNPHKSLLELCPKLEDQFVLINGMSKGYAMTGWRVGYAAGPEKLIKGLKSFQSHSSTCIPPFIEEAATWAINQGKDLLKQELAELKERRDFTIKCAEKIDGLKYIKPQGAFYLFVDIRGFLTNSEKYGPDNSLAFAEAFLDSHYVAVVPGEAFGAPGFLRFSYAASQETIEEGFNRFAKAIAEI